VVKIFFRIFPFGIGGEGKSPDISKKIRIFILFELFGGNILINVRYKRKNPKKNCII
jgi:hypothetical protein